jgi:hypothetical protein
MLIENALADAVRFFPMGALSSSVGFKVDFDMALLVLASDLYRLMARRMRGYDEARGAPNLPRLDRHGRRRDRPRARSHRALPPSRPPAHRAGLRPHRPARPGAVVWNGLPLRLVE